jgi:hypothetical protein
VVEYYTNQTRPALLQIQAALILVGWVRIQEGKKDPETIEKSEDISCFEVLYVLF